MKNIASAIGQTALRMKFDSAIRPWYNIRISRIYKDKDDWKDSNSFGRDDLLVLEKVINRAYDWLIDEAAKNNNNDSDD